MPREEYACRIILECTGCESRCILLITAESMDVPPEPTQCIFKEATVASDWHEKVD